MNYNEIDTDYFTELIKKYNLEHLGRSKEGKGWEAFLKVLKEELNNLK